MEEWREFREHYLVSSYGIVKNKEGETIKAKPNHKGYLFLCIGRPVSERKRYSIHRIVATAFIPNPKNLPQVNHKDANKLNNHVDNLEWCTNKENSIHAQAHGLIKGFVGEKHPLATLRNDHVIEIRETKLTKDFTRNMLCEKYGVSVHVVKDIRARRSWTHL